MIRGAPVRLRVAVLGLTSIVFAGSLFVLTRPAPSPVPEVLAAASPAPIPSPSPTPTPSPSPSPTPTPTPTPSPIPSLVPGISDLTGEHVADSVAHRLPIAVMIDDNRVARPQSGFNAASIVYQAPADGGETRYMLVFQQGDARDVGPVRSGREYFIQWASEIRAGFAHYGGDRISRAYLLAHDGSFFTDIDALRTTSRPFHRIRSRSAPHNAYTSTAALRAALPGLGGPLTMPAELPRRTFVDPAPLGARPPSESIRIAYRTGLVSYAYDRNSDLYLRSLDGRPQVDPADGRAVWTRNVVVLFMQFHTDSTIEKGHARPVLGSIGAGRALVFRDGRSTEASWRKGSPTELMLVRDTDGREIPLVRGRTFFQIVPIGTDVRWSPAS